MLDGRRTAMVGVIEDDEASRSAIGRLLEVSGYEPALFESAEAFMASPLTLDLLCLIVDVHLPGMSGLDLQRRLRAEGSQVPIVVTTASRAEMIRERAQQAGCAAFLCKPFGAGALLTLLASIAHQSHT